MNHPILSHLSFRIGFLSLYFVLLAQSQLSLATPKPQAPAKSIRPLLYSVSDGAKVSYLFGSIHAGVALEQMPPAVKAALDKSSLFVLEMDGAQLTPDLFLKHARIEGSKGLDQTLAPESWAQLKKALADSIPEEQLKGFKPWALATMLLQKMLVDYPGQLDQELRAKAVQAGTKLAFLETPQEQLHILERVLEEKELVEALDATKGRKELEALIAAYVAGDVDRLHRLMAEAIEPAKLNILLSRRNLDWVPKIREHLQQGGAFIGVGAGHLGGPYGLLRLLEIQGYRIQAIGPLERDLPPTPAAHSGKAA